MASTAPLKATVSAKLPGPTCVLHLLLLGLLLPAVFVSGQLTNSTNTTNTTTAAMMTSQSPVTTMSWTNTTSQAPTSTTPLPTQTSTAQLPTASGGTSATTFQSPTTTSGATATSQPSSSSTSGVTTSVPPTQTSMMTGTATTIQSTISTTFGGSTGGTNGTTTYSPASLYCPSFTCNYSDCYTMYTSQNATSCPAGCYCQLMRQMGECYVASCSVSCADRCVNASQTNCSVDCCNTTDCLNSTFASMMMNTTTVTPSTSTSPTTTTTTPAMTTPVTTVTSPGTTSNGNKCHQGQCTGPTCYMSFKDADPQTCSASQPHCQLKKETVQSEVKWTAGCIANCSGQTWCKATTQPPCHLECCNATQTSCLWLNGTMNVPSFATRGPYLHTELTACLFCLLVIAMIL